MSLVIYALSFPDQKELRALVDNMEDCCDVIGDLPVLEQIEVIKRNFTDRNIPFGYYLFKHCAAYRTAGAMFKNCNGNGVRLQYKVIHLLRRAKLNPFFFRG